MINISENTSLQSLHTFHTDATARFFSAFSHADDLQELLLFVQKERVRQCMVLGGGSNVLFTADYDGLLMKNEIRGIQQVGEDDQHYYIRTGAGENWHQFVMYCLDNQYFGVENLALIPGLTGATPMQNIGAYGVEIKDVFHSLEAFHIHDKSLVEFNNKDCAFGYRESVFKRALKGQFVIMSVTYRLNKKSTLNLDYGMIRQQLEKMNILNPDARDVAEAVMFIRRSKLPDPDVLGNAGSFFKNPVITQTHFQKLQKEYPAIVGYPSAEGGIKLAAGWLIEACGMKGIRMGDAGSHASQSLVLVNYGKATGYDILSVADKIKSAVYDSFQVRLEEEVNIIS